MSDEKANEKADENNALVGYQKMWRRSGTLGYPER